MAHADTVTAGRRPPPGPAAVAPPAAVTTGAGLRM
ncbi:MAG: hypothetical protein QOG44_3259, partial [Acidimicrobiaceae bacterium]|nr:hypothetical protein [Acidimicrobiaceae bacterium]